MELLNFILLKTVYMLPIAIPIVLAAVALASAGAKYKMAQDQADILRDKQNLLGKRKEDPDIKNLVGMSQAQLNARAPGVVNAEQGILGQQANTVSQIEKNSLDSAQALSLIGALQGRTNTAISGLATLDQQYKQTSINQLQNALGLKSRDNEAVWADKLNQYNMQAAILGTQMQNTAGAIDSVAGTAGSLATLYA